MYTYVLRLLLVFVYQIHSQGLRLSEAMVEDAYPSCHAVRLNPEKCAGHANYLPQRHALRQANTIRKNSMEYFAGNTLIQSHEILSFKQFNSHVGGLNSTSDG